jgi:DNA-binding XRE family transcriptional regulator
VIEPLGRDVQVSRIGPDGRVTHVSLPAAEYRRLVQEAGERMMERALAVLNDPHTEWFDGNDVLDAMQAKDGMQKLLDKGGYELPATESAAARGIASVRKALGLTQKALGERVGLPQSQISRIERHPERSSLAMLKRIAAALNIDVRQIV